MPPLFWSGKLTFPMKLLVESNNILAFFMGSASDILGMKERVRQGYEGEYSDHVHQYDELGFALQDRSARHQLEGLSLEGMRLLDVGCGTGALARVAFEKGARAAVCGDISAFMLKLAAAKEVAPGVEYSFCQLDADNLPYRDGSFDAVISGMIFGNLPNQERAFAEMVRLVKPGGLVCIGAHGPEHYWEAIDASFRSITKRYVLGYRIEWWPQTEGYIHGLLDKAGLDKIHSRRVTWHTDFGRGGAMYDFFAAISSTYWFAKLPPEKRKEESEKIRRYFEHKNLRTITDDIIVAYGYKPLS